MSRISTEEMQNVVSRMYSADKWQKKVHAMSDVQIFAIYQREMLKREELEAEARAEKRRAAKGQPPANDDTLF